MKKLFTLLALSAITFVYSQKNIAIDKTFGQNGFLTIPIAMDSYNFSITDSPDGKLLGYGMQYPSFDKYIYKINLDGTLDTSFGTNGILNIPAYGGDFKVYKQGSDKILVLYCNNYDDTAQSRVKRIARYNLDGTLDTTFASNGTFTHYYRFSSETYTPNSIAVLNDNSILLADGTYYIKLTKDGVIDTTYGTNGGNPVANNSEIMLSKDNNILQNFQMGITKTTINGEKVTSFANNGFFKYTYNGTVSSPENSTI